MLELRTYLIGEDGCVVAARGDLDDETAAQLLTEVERRLPRRMVVDLLDARPVDFDALDALVAAADATFVAQRPLHDALDVIALHRHVDIRSTLAAAVS